MVPESADGFLLIALTPVMPESARFLQQMGRGEEARASWRDLALVAHAPADNGLEDHSHLPPNDTNFLGLTLALTLAALAWGLVNFGLPVVAAGRSGE